MGISGLWDILRPASEQVSLVKLAVEEGFQKNASGKRGFRVGIDASIWFYHATYGREGENPELRTLFFRLARLLQDPFLPLFVFDGPERPEFKRGKRISGKGNWMENGMKNLIDAFGFEWRQAPGEAEAELAYLNRIGIIDAILTDDGDTFLFGAKVVIRNPSNTLSGNKSNPIKNADGRDDGKHSMIYRSQNIADRADIGLTRGGFVLMGLLCGGDYQQSGLEKCGKQTAVALAKCGFGDELLEAVQGKPSSKSQDTYILWEIGARAKLAAWRRALREELASNSKGFLGRKLKSLSNSIPNDFPMLEVLLSYIHPITSESKGWKVSDSNMWLKEPILGDIAHCCEKYFEWGVKDIILKRFRTVIWPGACSRILRRAALDQDRNMRDPTPHRATTPTTPRRVHKTAMVASPSKIISEHFSRLSVRSPQRVHSEYEEDVLMIKIHSSRRHASTDEMLEYRVEVSPRLLVSSAESGIQGIRKAEDLGIGAGAAESEFEDEDEVDAGNGRSGARKAPPDPDSHLRVWLPACMMEYVHPELVQAFEQRKAGKGKGRAKKGATQKPLDVSRSKKLVKSKQTLRSKDSNLSPTIATPDAASTSFNPSTRKHTKTPSCSVITISDDETKGIDDSRLDPHPLPADTSILQENPGFMEASHDVSLDGCFQEAYSTGNRQGLVEHLVKPSASQVLAKGSVLSIIENWKPGSSKATNSLTKVNKPPKKGLLNKTDPHEKSELNLGYRRTKVATAIDVFSDEPATKVPDIIVKPKSRIASALSSTSDVDDYLERSPRKSHRKGPQHSSPNNNRRREESASRSISPTPMPKHLACMKTATKPNSTSPNSLPEYIEISSDDGILPISAMKMHHKPPPRTKKGSRKQTQNIYAGNGGKNGVRGGRSTRSNNGHEIIDLVSP
ncbi:hypothetical protein FRC02_004430 [Tulasnella sp. 418]|nr:hypothetical protein FRC02_004430 [Tulasnella sp. 418]